MAATDGKGFTNTVIVDVFLQFALLVPVTIYVVVINGETMNGLPVPIGEPGLSELAHEYIFAPTAVSAAVCPTQMVVGFAAGTTVGNGFTIIATLSLDRDTQSF